MQSRVKQVQKRIQTEIEEKEGLLKDLETPVDLKVMPLRHYKETLIAARHFGLRYEGAKQDLFEDLNFEIKHGDRVFFKGENGSGKTSIIKAILKNDEKLLQTGELQIASGLEISYINQDTSFLKGTLRSYCERNGLDEGLFCSVLRQLDLGREQFSKNMEDYSEGQKKKVLVAASLMKPAPCEMKP